MNCLNAEHIERYLEGDLSPAEREELERHLGACPACRRAVEDERRLTEAARSLAPLTLPAGFSARVMALIPERTRVSVFGWLALGATAGVSLLAVVVGALVLSGHSLTDLVMGFEGFLVSTFKNGAMLFGQATAFVGLCLSVVRHFLVAMWEGLSGIGSVVPLPVCVAVLAVLLLIVASSICAVRRILIGVRS